MIKTDVLIVGGSLVGLSAASFLAWHGVSTLSVERHRGTAIHPRAGHFHLRTLEVLRSIGLEGRVRAASEAQFDPDGGINAVESLAGKEIATYIANLNEGVAAISPSTRLFMTQQSLEPLIRGRAEELGAALHYATELVSLEQDADGVTGHVRNVETGETDTVRAKYLIAADGNRSPIRERLGIATRGPGHLADCVTIYFHADCGAALRGRNLGVIYVFNADQRGFFRLVKTGDSGFLAVMTLGDMSLPNATKVAHDIDEERCIALVHSATGMPDAKVEIEDIATWRAVAEVAERFQDGRVFLVGDAAHVMPPMGGFGGNTGVQDAHNLAWKIALVLKGLAGPDLLSTFNTERQPIGELAIQQAYTRYVLRVVPERGKETAQPIVDDLSMEIGYRYHSRAIAAEPGSGAALYENPRQSKAMPGTRAPHVVLQRAGARLSSLDLFGKNFCVLAAADGGPWCDAARTAAADLGLPLDVYRIDRQGTDVSDPEGRFADAYGLSPTGAVIVRPDGFVAWRAKDAGGASKATMAKVLSSLLCRNG
ncbi:MAG TPA: FAD-dependent monooxygenase [Xanthobacteraceae bacterium]|nr:FAD-dependent monooxygenase [Xanthobacteraceae bacterium]